jgi:DNA polymerase III delta prime subunit
MYKLKGSTWLISPQRLISGMSYVGQWENRLLAILKTAKKSDVTLYFDDLIGLFSAGITSQSQLSVADVMKPMLEKHEFQMLGEITPTAFRVLQERERSFADLFHLIPVKETTSDETLKILIGAKRQLEHNHNCWFEPEVLPTAINIQHRYVKDAVFPGKAAYFLRQLAIKYRNSRISRNDLLAEFQAKSGLSLAFLDDNTKLSRKEIIEALNKEIIGQTSALEAAADVISIAKAKLNDSERPLATFLFLGPTGVGKTQCAKALAKYLFGSADRLLRFDMNEFITSDSLARLVGTFHQPEGLLTSAIRRQPFSVLLLDEIEKADPDIFNLLLQVLGEGRLTDASGRTVDFTNVLIIMTSNLGVKEANTKLGFQQSENNETAVYLQAVEKFFRPEFFNRIDRVIPFRKLSRQDMSQIAMLLIQSIFSREGLIRRKCLLDIDDQAMEKIIDEGYNPTFGARALKRVIEKQITQPVANQLIALSNEVPTVINIYSTKNGINVYLDTLTEISASEDSIIKADLQDTTSVFNQIENSLPKIETRVDKLSPKGAIDPSNLDPATFHYFQIKDQMRRVNAICRNIKQNFNITNKTGLAKQPVRSNRQPSGYKKEYSLRRTIDHQGFWKKLFAAEDIHYALQEISNSAVLTNQEIKDRITEALREFTLLQLMVDTDFNTKQQAIIYIHPIVSKNLNLDVSPQELLKENYLQLFNSKVGLESIEITAKEISPNDKVILVTGTHALALTKLEEGTHLFSKTNGQLYPMSVRIFPLNDGEKPVSPILEFINNTRQWLNLFLSDDDVASNNPNALMPVIRIYEENGMCLDLKTGLITDLYQSQKEFISVAEMHIFLLSALKYPFVS